MIFKSNRQLWLTHDGEREKMQFPVLPEKFSVSLGTKNTSVTISGLGEIIILQDRPAVEVSWDGFFPATYFPGLQTRSITSPKVLLQKLCEWKNSDKPAHLILTGTSANFYAAIQTLQPYEQGGDPDTTKSSSRSTERSRSGRSKLILLGRRPSLRARPGQITAFRQKLTR